MSTIGTLEMDSEALSNLSSNIGAAASSLGGLNSNFKNAADTITSAESWVGDDANNFLSVATNLYNELEKARGILEDVQADLSQTSSTYEEVSEGVDGMIKGML